MPKSKIFRKTLGALGHAVAIVAASLVRLKDHQTPAEFVATFHQTAHDSRRSGSTKHGSAKDKKQDKQNKHNSTSESLGATSADDDKEIHSSPESAEDGDEEEEDRLENFSEVLNALDLGKLQQAAFIARWCQTPPRGESSHFEAMMSMTCTISPVPMCGSYNLAYLITFPDGIQWIARIPGHGFIGRWGVLDKQKMQAEYQAVQHVRANTSIPVPEIFTYNTSLEYAGAPFALTSFVEGTPLSELWTHKLCEEKRLQVLSEIAGHMSQLRTVSFDRLGMPRFGSNGEYEGVGESIALLGHMLNPWHTTNAYGSYNTFLESLWDAFDEHEDMHVNQRSNIPILRMAIKSMPTFLTEDLHFCLNFCDFNYQNILVDEDCHVIGFIDWDGTQSEPGCAGYARYPSWITRDWDPIMYDYDNDAPLEGASANESSPETLSSYRQHYAAEFAKHAVMLNNHHDPRMTMLSHIVEAICLAVISPINRSLIVDKLLEHAFDGQVPFSDAEYIVDYIQGCRTKKDKLIEEAFSKMWHAEWEESATNSSWHENNLDNDQQQRLVNQNDDDDILDDNDEKKTKQDYDTQDMKFNAAVTRIIAGEKPRLAEAAEDSQQDPTQLPEPPIVNQPDKMETKEPQHEVLLQHDADVTQENELEKQYFQSPSPESGGRKTRVRQWKWKNLFRSGNDNEVLSVRSPNEDGAGKVLRFFKK